MIEPGTSDGIEDARQFAAHLEVSDFHDQRVAPLEDLAPVLALFARARARQEIGLDSFSIKSVASSTERTQ